MIIGESILAIESVLKFKHWYRLWNSQYGWPRKAYEPKKLWCLCPKIEYFGISVPFCYYSLLGRVIDFPSRVRVVKKIPSTGRVASTRHSLVWGDQCSIPLCCNLSVLRYVAHGCSAQSIALYWALLPVARLSLSAAADANPYVSHHTSHVSHAPWYQPSSSQLLLQRMW